MQKVKVLTIGDVHIKVNNIPECTEMISRLVDLAKKESPDFIVCLGDVLDRHSNIHVQCLILAEKLTQAMSEIAPFFLLVGNHDRPNNSNFLTEEHPFNAMKKWDNVTIVDTTVEYFFKDYRFVLVPYVPPGMFDKALQMIPNPYENVTAYFAHQEFEGAKMGAIVSQCGDKWSPEKSLCVSGHIHSYDYLQPNMIYTGTPIQHSFGDSVNNTVSMFTFNEKEWEQERIDLGMIKKVTIYLTPEEVATYVVPQNKIVKIVIRGEEADIKTIAKLEKIQELKRQGVKIAFKVTQSTEVSTSTLPKMPYKDRLYQEMRKDLYSLMWFNKLFK